jgi:uncharacterized membrane protein/protein-disulfide isomerase
MSVTKPYNQGVSIVTLNRILIILGVLGLFVAGVLTVQHVRHLEIPCTAGGGCLTVAQHPTSYVRGIPVAYFGLAGYFLLTALAVIRGFTGKYYEKLLTLPSYIGSAFGMIASLYLQYISFAVIQAKCIWCISSAVIMVLTFVFNTILFGRMGSKESEEPPVSNPSVLLQGMAGILLASFGVAGFTVGQNQVGPKAEMLDMKVAERLVPEPRSARNQLGPDDAPVTLIEFADLCCPQCRTGLPKIHDLVTRYPGKIRVVYRHFPIYQLPGHEMTLRAVITSELAAQKGKFWEFADAFSAAEEAPKTAEGVNSIAQTVGITGEDIDKAIQDDDSIPSKNLTRDFEDASGLFGINSTPTFMIYIKGMPIKKMTFAQMMNEIQREEIQKYLRP